MNKTTKTCSACASTKPTADYYADKRAPDGLRAACKECVKERNRAQQKADPAKHNARIKVWNARNPEKARDTHKRSRAKRKAKLAENHKHLG